MDIDVTDNELVKLIGWHSEWMQHVVVPKDDPGDYYVERINRLHDIVSTLRARLVARRVPD